MEQSKIKITESGLIALSKRIAGQEQLVKEIQAEKVVAYTLSGDGWHDNPGFNALEQKEFAACEELAKLLKIRETAMLIRFERRNTQSVQIGSIVEMEQISLKDGSVKVLIWEIVGYLESNVKQGKIAYDSPMAAAILGKLEGEEGEIFLPMGKIKFKIIRFYENWESVNRK